MSYTIVNFDDWQALYDEQGVKVLEDHRLDLRSVLSVMGVDCDFKFASQIFDLETVQTGVVPEGLSGYPDYAFTK